jgi:hypothetical protein
MATIPPIPTTDREGSVTPPPAKTQNELLGIITHAVSEVVNLKIITVVTPVTVSGTLDKPQVGFDQSNKAGAIATCINLLEGDITTAIDPVYAGNPDDPVRQYHTAQVQEAKEIVDRNLKTIADLIERLWDKVEP